MVGNGRKERMAIIAPTRRQLIGSTATAFGVLALATKGGAQSAGEISRAAESIHQEPLINASRKRVYEALTIASKFNEVTKIAAVKDPAISVEKSPTVISSDAGGAFSLF